MVAETLSSIMRAYNLIGRWGGEEFLGIITHIDGEVISMLAEKLSVLVENSFLDYNDKKINITVTIGEQSPGAMNPYNQFYRGRMVSCTRAKKMEETVL